MTRSFDRRDRLVAALLAGIAGGIGVAIYAALSELDEGNGPGVTYTFLASAVLGPAAANQPWAVPVGVATLFAATIAWAYAYVYAAQRQPQLIARPIVSGIFFGMIVWFIDLLVLLVVTRFTPTLYSLDSTFIGAVAFFGIPLAFVAARFLRAR